MYKRERICVRAAVCIRVCAYVSSEIADGSFVANVRNETIESMIPRDRQVDERDGTHRCFDGVYFLLRRTTSPLPLPFDPR